MRINRAYALAGVAILGFGLMLGYAFYQLNKIERTLASYVGENMFWAVNQAEREMRRFADTLLLEGDDKEQVVLRLEILKSRIALLQEGPQLEYIKSIGAEEYLKNIVAATRFIDEQYAAGQMSTQSEIVSVYRSIQPAFLDINRIANLTMLHETDQGGKNRDRQLGIIYLAITAIIGLTTAGGLLSFLLILNIKSAQRANSELIQHKEELERTVEQRTEALRVALKNEQRNNEIYKGFLTTVSHQFKTPVAIIDLIVQRFIRHPQDISIETVTEAATRIREAVKRLVDIIESTISGEILDGNIIRLKSSRFDLVEMVQQSISYHSELFSERQIEIVKETSFFEYFGDKTLLEQIILNLLANAEKYSPRNSKIAVTIAEANNDFVFRVKDAGMGVPLDEADKIFNRFYRASNVAHLQGSGLGLSFSKQIAEMHGGSLKLLSNKAGCTEFELILPMRD